MKSTILTPWNIAVTIVSAFFTAIVIVSIHASIGVDTEKIRSSAWFIMQGMVPYKELLEFNQPGTLLYTIGLMLVGSTDIVFRLADILLLGVSSVIIWKLNKGTMYSMAPVLLFAGYYLVFMGNNATMQRDSVIAGLILGSALAGAGWINSHKMQSLVIAGVLVGYASTIKADALLFMAPIVAIAIRQDRNKALMLAAGFAFPWVVCLSWVASYGALADLWWVTANMIPMHNGPQTWGLMPSISIEMRIVVTICVTVAVFAVTFLRPSKKSLLIGLTAIAALHVIIQNKGFGAHYIPLMAMVGTAFQYSSPKKARLLLALASAIIWPAVYFTPGAIATAAEATTYKRTSVQESIARLPHDARIQPLAYVDSVSGAMFRERRMPATGMVYDLFLFMGNDSQTRRTLRQRFLGDVTKNPPDYFVSSVDSDPRGFKKLQAWPEFNHWLQANYNLEVDNPDFRIWRLKQSNPVAFSRTLP
ncbi:hypothetical protein KJ766_03230 [Patescibacteria group bacterium]|nr:hypothetical protein [Patescibacteria group bacterium]